MKLTIHFQSFLCDVVNLNDERIERLKGHVGAIEGFLKESDYGTRILGFSKQGSWAHKTIIRPPAADQRFDADLVMYVTPRDDWTARDYVEGLWRIFRDSKVYRDKATRNTRCVTIEYAKDFDLDVVPVIRRDLDFLGSLSGERPTFSVCNRLEDAEEATDPEAYTAWIKRVDSDAGGMMRKVTRLLKYLRDTKSRFSVKSVLLTTLLTERAEARIAAGNQDCWSDLPTALKTLVGDLDGWLQARPDLPEVCNPKVPGESFTRHWDQDKYANFRTCIHRYRGWIDDAFLDADRQSSVEKWRRLFGDDFAPSVVVETVKSVAYAEQDDKSIVARIVRFGASVIESLSLKAPHQKTPTWHRSGTRISVVVTATLHNGKGGAMLQPLQSGEVIGPDYGIKFRARVGFGTLPADWRIAWRITNTGAEALRLGQPRGGFEMSGRGSVEHWETTAFLGVHWVEAFVLDNHDFCRGESDRFYVVVDK